MRRPSNWHFGEQFGEVSEDLLGGPLVAVIEADDFAVRADEGGGQGVGDGLVGLRGEADVEVVSHGGQGGFAGDGEVPVREGFFRIGADVGLGVGAEAGRGVVVWIEAGAEQVGVRVEAWIAGEGFFNDGEVVGNPGAEVGEGAAGVDKGNEQSFATELGEVKSVAVLICEVEVRNFIAGLRDVELDGGAVVSFGLPSDDDVVEEDSGVGALGDEDVGGEQVAGVKLAEDARITQFVRHSHGRHEAGNRLVIEGDFARGRVGGNDFAAQGIGFEVGLGRLGGAGIGVAAGGDGEQGEEQEWEGREEESHSLV